VSKKEYTPIEVAKSVLKKTEEMIKSWKSMAKAAKDYPKALAAENIKEHMKHKEEHPGGAKQAVAIGIEQARHGEHEAKKSEMEKSAEVNKSPAQAAQLKGVSVPKPPQMPKQQAMKSPRPLKQFMQKREGKKGGSK
jgi:hypothetical protein